MLLQPKYFPSERKEMLRFITNAPETILEIGCREAIFSKHLKNEFNAKELWGIDPDERIVNEAESNLDHFINDFFSPKTNLPKNYFDLVVFNDILEHVYDPWEMLINTKKLLKSNGKILISLPNIRHKSVLKNLLFHDKFEYAEYGIMDISHIRFFTETTMKQMLTDCGYNVEKCEPIFPRKKRFFRSLFNYITNNRFSSMNIIQFGITASKREEKA